MTIINSCLSFDSYENHLSSVNVKALFKRICFSNKFVPCNSCIYNKIKKFSETTKEFIYADRSLLFHFKKSATFH